MAWITLNMHNSPLYITTAEALINSYQPSLDTQKDLILHSISGQMQEKQNNGFWVKLQPGHLVLQIPQ